MTDARQDRVDRAIETYVRQVVAAAPDPPAWESLRTAAHPADEPPRPDWMARMRAPVAAVLAVATIVVGVIGVVLLTRDSGSDRIAVPAATGGADGEEDEAVELDEPVRYDTPLGSIEVRFPIGSPPPDRVVFNELPAFVQQPEAVTVWSRVSNEPPELISNPPHLSPHPVCGEAGCVPEVVSLLPAGRELVHWRPADGRPVSPQQELWTVALDETWTLIIGGGDIGSALEMATRPIEPTPDGIVPLPADQRPEHGSLVELVYFAPGTTMADPTLQLGANVSISLGCELAQERAAGGPPPGTPGYWCDEEQDILVSISGSPELVELLSDLRVDLSF